MLGCDNLLFDFAVVGGDRRFFYLAKFLKSKNFNVIGFNLANLTKEVCGVEAASSLKQALLYSKNWILPIPVSRNGVFLNFSDEFGSQFRIKELLGLVKKSTGVFGGSFSLDFFSELKKRAKFVYDYLENESFAVFNAGLTAQAAVAQAVLKNSTDFRTSSCLVLGFGRCGKLLALRLKGLCGEVVVSTHNEIEMAWARALGFRVVNLSDLKKGLNLKRFGIIFNTIPSRVLSGVLLERLNKEVFVFDITQNGIDCEEFKKKSIDVFVSLQIPGKFKFKPSAEYLSNLTLEVLKIKH